MSVQRLVTIAKCADQVKHDFVNWPLEPEQSSGRGWTGNDRTRGMHVKAYNAAKRGLLSTHSSTSLLAVFVSCSVRNKRKHKQQQLTILRVTIRSQLKRDDTPNMSE